DLAVDFCQDFGGQDVGQLSLSVQTVDSLQVLRQLKAVLSLQGTALSNHGDLLDRERHFCEVLGSAQSFSSSSRHTRTEVVGVDDAGRVTTGVLVTNGVSTFCGASVGARELGVWLVVECFVTSLVCIARTH